ncbi:microtubule-associated protein rp eb family member [Cystoisospora suis]|uniref:Microtubule-associated protein rp eb family member n=1 Tax=Cystoisospora suis TaxID=483139 RepID=A0A2C6KT01_9APIC|nr:microtubule-associated protein rp eb family member [Cystoisospora suis]
MALAHSTSGTVRDSDPSSVGMMEGAFFVSRTELLDWVNHTFNLSLTKVEQAASGAVYLQIMDGLYGGGNKVPMAKVKWNCKLDYEYIQNYKLLQSVFTKQGVKKHIEVEKLIKGKYQDNLEFLQWLKAFYDRQSSQFRKPDKPYNGYERRKLAGSIFPEWAQPNDHLSTQKSVGKDSSLSSHHHHPSLPNRSSTPQVSPSTTTVTRGGHHDTPSLSRRTTSSTSQPSTARPASNTEHRRTPSGQSRAAQGPEYSSGRTCETSPACVPTSSSGQLPHPGVSGTLRELQAEISRLRELVAKGEEEVEQAWLERDFYFQKLRRIEVMCSASSSQQTDTLAVKDILAVLYATDELSDEEGLERGSEEDGGGQEEAVHPRGVKRAGDIAPRGQECTMDVQGMEDKDCFLGRTTATEQIGDVSEPMVQ